MRPAALLLAGVAATLALLVGFAAPASASFKRGVNLSHWLQYSGRQPVSAADMQLIAAAGFDHVRLPFDPVLMGWDALAPDPETPMSAVNRIEAGVDMALAAGLSVIVDFHPTSETQELIEGKPAARDAYLALWSWLAKRLAGRPADRVAFELMNEPQYYARGATPWNALQAKAVAAVRAVAPHNLLLLSGIHGSSIDALERTATVDDRNVCYVFHFYDPQLVTHLGADWDPYPDRAQGMMRGLVYPASDMTLAKVQLKPGAKVNVVGDAVRKYLNEGWNAELIGERIGVARDWAAAHHACLQATEFGILRGGLDVGSRLRWMGDVRGAMEIAGVGWTIWDYADLFGIANTTGSVARISETTTIAIDPLRISRSFDPLALVALDFAKPELGAKAAPVIRIVLLAGLMLAASPAYACLKDDECHAPDRCHFAAQQSDGICLDTSQMSLGPKIPTHKSTPLKDRISGDVCQFTVDCAVGLNCYKSPGSAEGKCSAAPR